MQPNRYVSFFVVVWLVYLTQAAAAQSQDDARAKSLFAELRCVVCQNQSILESDADVAKDLRQIVREQIQNGRTDGQIREFLVERYGEFILLRPRFSWHTAALWLGPLLLLFLGGVALFVTARRKQEITKQAPLTPQEEEELGQLIGRQRSVGKGGR